MSSRAIYRQEVIDRAREHHEAGWPKTKIRDLLSSEFGHAPHQVTIAGWVDEKYAERRRRETRAAKRRHVSRQRKARRDVSPELRLERMKQLREENVGFRSIGVISGIFWGEPLSAETVRYRLHAAGIS